MSSSFNSWFKSYLDGTTEDWTSKLSEYYKEKYKGAKNEEWVKQGIIESYKVVTDIYKSLLVAISAGLVSWMVAQVPTDTKAIPTSWNLLMVAFFAVLVLLLHFRMSYKISILNSRMDAICGVAGEIFEKAEEEE